MDDKFYYDYNSIHKDIEMKANTIKKEFDVDIILAIGGGGLIPARIIRTFLDKPIYVVSVRGYDEKVQTGNIEVIQWIDNNFSGKNVLIVDEVDDTRATLKFCIERLKLINNANKLGIFVVNNKRKEKVWKIDQDIKYFSARDMEDVWIVYPWDTNLIV